MCGRSTLTKNEKELEERFKSTFYSDDLERYNGLPSFNIAPTHMHPIITSNAEHFNIMKWGLIPSWAKNESIGSKMINARIETITEKTSFKNLIDTNRCIVPFDGYYEWKNIGNQKIPYYVHFEDHKVFSLAGIWTSWLDDNQNKVNSFSVITLNPTESLAKLHHRMPAFLKPKDEKVWLDTTLPFNEVKSILQDNEVSDIRYHKVSKRVNKVMHNDASLIVKDDTPLPPVQGTLF